MDPRRRCRRLGVSRRLLAQLEAGQANPSLSTLLSIAAGFDISLVELLAGGDKPAITVQPDNASAPVLWNGEARRRGPAPRRVPIRSSCGTGRWRPATNASSDAHRPNAREVLLVTAGP